MMFTYEATTIRAKLFMCFTILIALTIAAVFGLALGGKL